MYQPQLIEVDPQRIKFSALNPRKHGGEEYQRLKQSIQAIGIVQMPIVRVLPGGFYEVIDGEGRVKVAQEIAFSKVWVISLGSVNDQDALTMLQSSNTVREFSFIAECRGMANLHRQGQANDKLAKSLGIAIRSVQQYVGIGYFPDELFEMIQKDTRSTAAPNSEVGIIWGQHTFSTLLPLRQLKQGKQPDAVPLDGVYDYSEVQKAVEKVITGEISSGKELVAYVEKRRRELFEQRFNKELQQRLQAELDQAKQALEEAAQQKMHNAEEETKRRYEGQVATLQDQLKEAEERYNKIVREVAKKPDEKELIAKRERELGEQIQKTKEERQSLQDLQRQIQEDIDKTKQQTLKELRKQLDADLKEQRKTLKEEYEEQRKTLEKEHKKAEADLKAFYTDKDQKRQLKAEESVRQMGAHGVELLSQTQQWFLHITSPDMLKGLEWLSEAEIVGLIAQMRTVRDILETAENTIRYGNATSPQERVISEASMNERSLARG